MMTYTALAAETEVIENLREVLEGLQVRRGGRGWGWGLRNLCNVISLGWVPFADLISWREESTIATTKATNSHNNNAYSFPRVGQFISPHLMI